jgi:hypothetical protein
MPLFPLPRWASWRRLASGAATLAFLCLALPARADQAFRTMDPADRAALIRFLESP